MKIGNTDINSFKIGNTTVNKIYSGTKQVFPNVSLDLSTASNAYSLRKLRTLYTGYAIKVRRASDNSEQDIGFSGSQLDIASINSFCSGTNGFVTIWYDQSGNANNAIQTTSSNQPQIYDSITGVYLLNGKPSILYSHALGATSLAYSNLTGSASYSVSSVFSAIEATRYTKLLSIGPDASAAGVWFTINTAGTALEWIDNDTGFAGNGYNNASGPSVIGNSRIIPDSITTQNILTTVLSSSNAKMFKNGTEISYRIQRTGNCYTTTGNLIIGNSPNTANKMSGRLQELIVWQSDQASNISDINININNFYNTY